MEKVVIHPKTQHPVFLTPLQQLKNSRQKKFIWTMPCPFPFPFSNLLPLLLFNHYLIVRIKQSNPFFGF